MTINSVKKHVQKLLNATDYNCASIEIQKYGNDYFYNTPAPHPEAICINFDFWNVPQNDSNAYFNEIRKLARKINNYAARYNLLLRDKAGFIILMLPEDRYNLTLYDKYAVMADNEFCEYDHEKRERTGKMITNEEGHAIIDKYEKEYLKAIAAEKTA